MISRIGLPLIAVLGVAFAWHMVARTNQPVVAAQPVVPPAEPEFSERISGAGIVEASTENIAVGTILPGVVSEVFVKVGDRVQRGAPLFAIDARDWLAERAVRLAQIGIAKAQLERLRAAPRPEDVPPVEARVKEAEAALTDARNQWNIAEALTDKRAISTEELDRRRMAVQVAEARLAQSKAQLDLIQAGTWRPELLVAEAELAQAEAALQRIETDIERATVRAPVDCTILQVKTRVGEFAQTGQLATPLMLVGDTQQLHVRADIDENDAWRFQATASAVAFVRGNRDLSTPLTFVRVEPYVVPKRSLTGDSTERVDTRVLQVLYRFDPAALSVYVGQQMDVFIEAPRSKGATTQTAGR